MPNISVVIPTFNGLSLLKRNLPTVLHSLDKDDELIVIDDASTDKTIEYLKKTYICHKKNNSSLGKFEVDEYLGASKNNVTIRVLKNKQNQRFAESANRGIFAATNPRVLLLNNDVLPQKNLKQKLLNCFDNENVFAVGCKEVEKNGVLGGKNQLWFNRGLFQHSRAKDFTTGETAWASGGSAMFDREKWLTLNGFDNDFYPAYWEDIDLSFRAKKRGWKVLFCSEAIVEHHHESTNNSVFGQEEIKKLSWKQSTIFTWKNSDLIQKVSFIFWQFYWSLLRFKTNLKYLLSNPIGFLDGNRKFFTFLLLIIFASFLRFYKLADVPHGMTWDEAAIGYNGFAIYEVHRDEWLQFMPVSFKSFGDFKAPLAIYINGISTLVFGMNLWAVRLPFVLASIAGILGFMFLTEEYLLNKNDNRILWPVIGGFILATTPWFLHLTRTGFESGMATSFFIWSIFFYTKMINKIDHENQLISSLKKSVFSWKHNRHLLIYGLLGTILAVMSIYTYHSSKIVVPLVVLPVALSKIKSLWKIASTYLVAIAGILFLYPLVKDSFFANGLERSKTMIVFQVKTFAEFVQIFMNNLQAHFSLSFLVFGETDSLRHGDGKWGVLLVTTLICILLALVFFVIRVFRHRAKVNETQTMGWLIYCMLIGFLPALLGAEIPHSNRALMALPALVLLAIIGLKYLYQELIFRTKYRLIAKSFFGLLILFHTLFFLAYQKDYYQVFSKNSANDFKDGYTEAFTIANDYEKGLNGRKQVDKIVFTSDYGQPYIYALFVRKTNPIWYQGGSLVKYEFTDKINIADLLRNNALIVASSSDDLPLEKATHLVLGSDKKVKFKIYVTN